MVDFRLTDEQLALQQTARKFAQTEMAPQAAHYDQTGEFPRAIIESAWKVGLINESIPGEYGGLGLDGLSACVLTEELAAGCAGMTTSMMVNTLGQTPSWWAERRSRSRSGSSPSRGSSGSAPSASPSPPAARTWPT
jgi:acyl-CoA dehydrogenase